MDTRLEDEAMKDVRCASISQPTSIFFNQRMDMHMHMHMHMHMPPSRS